MGYTNGMGRHHWQLDPSAHDYEQIVDDYNHLNHGTRHRRHDNGTVPLRRTDTSPGKWGNVVEHDWERGRPSLPQGTSPRTERVFTFVVYPDKAENATSAVAAPNDGGETSMTAARRTTTAASQAGGKQDGGNQRHGKRSGNAMAS